MINGGTKSRHDFMNLVLLKPRKLIVCIATKSMKYALVTRRSERCATRLCLSYKCCKHVEVGLPPYMNIQAEK